jgi:hypothetical protein
MNANAISTANSGMVKRLQKPPDVGCGFEACTGAAGAEAAGDGGLV